MTGRSASSLRRSRIRMPPPCPDDRPISRGTNSEAGHQGRPSRPASEVPPARFRLPPAQPPPRITNSNKHGNCGSYRPTEVPWPPERRCDTSKSTARSRTAARRMRWIPCIGRNRPLAALQSIPARSTIMCSRVSSSTGPRGPMSPNSGRPPIWGPHELTDPSMVPPRYPCRNSDFLGASFQVQRQGSADPAA